MNDVTLRQLEYFLAAFDEGSVTRAAQRCNVSQAAVTMAINELERIIGVQLLVRRKSSGVRSTTSGLAVIPRVRQIMDSVKELPQLARTELKSLEGVIRVGCLFPLTPHLVPRIIEHFQANYPSVQINFIEGSSPDLTRGLDDGSLDIVLTFLTQVPSEHRIEKIVEFQQQIMLSARHPLATRQEITFSELVGEPAILYSVPPSAAWVERVMRMEGVIPDVKWRTTNMETIREMVRRGLGYSLVNLYEESWTHSENNNGDLAFVPVKSTYATNAIVAVYPDLNHIPRRVSVMVDYCREVSSTWSWVHS